MKKQNWKSKKWDIYDIPEYKYNNYEGVHKNKRRQVLIWNNSLSLRRKVICFHCTSKTNPKNHFLLKINTKGNKETYVDLSRIYFVNIWDINWKSKWGKIIFNEDKDRINNFLKIFFWDNFFE